MGGRDLDDVGRRAAYGYFAPQPPTGSGTNPRDLAAWLSPRDCAELVRAAVEAEGISFAIANGVSANRYRFAELSETCAKLGYRPIDDAWAYLSAYSGFVPNPVPMGQETPVPPMPQ